MLDLKGVIPALTTPFNDDQSLDLDGYKTLIETVIADGVHGILVAGCTGESWALDPDETLAVFKAGVAAAKGRVPVVAGCGAMLPKQAIFQVRQAEKAGCDVAMVQAPWYVMPGLEEVMDYYKAIIAQTEIPIMVYNNPRRTGIHMTADFISRLADEPRVIALKESSKDWLVLSEIIRRCRGRINVLCGYADLLGLAAIGEGAVGFVEGSPPIVGRRYVDFYNAAMSGDRETARDLQARFAKLCKALFGIGTFPASAKAALEMLGRPGGRTRDPIRPLNDAQRAQVRQVLIEMGLLDATGNRVVHVANGTVASAKGDLATRLQVLYEGIAAVIAEYSPMEAAIEETFMARNANSAIKLGHARGVIILAAARAGLGVSEYAPNLIKKSVVGAGHAGKEQVQAMVERLLPGARPGGADASDALAVALCHAHLRATSQRIAAGTRAAVPAGVVPA